MIIIVVALTTVLIIKRPTISEEKPISIDDKYDSIKNIDIMSNHQLYTDTHYRFRINKTNEYKFTGCINDYNESSIKNEWIVTETVKRLNNNIKSFIDKVNKKNEKIQINLYEPFTCSNVLITKRNSCLIVVNVEFECSVNLKYDILDESLCRKIDRISYMVTSFCNDNISKIEFLDEDKKNLFTFN